MKSKRNIITLTFFIIISLCSCGTKNIQYIIPAEYLTFYDSTAEEGVEIIKNLSLDYEDITINKDGDIIIEVTKEQSMQWLDEKENYETISKTNAQKESVEFSLNKNYTTFELNVPNDRYEFYNKEDSLKDLASDILFFQCILRENSNDTLRLEITVINIDTGESSEHEIVVE